MRDPFKVSLVAASTIFLAAVLAFTLSPEEAIGDLPPDGDTLTPWVLYLSVFVLAALLGVLALLGTWLGLRGAKVQRSPYRAGLVVALLYVGAAFLTVSFGPFEYVPVSPYPKVEVLFLCSLWGIAVPYLIALLVRRLRFLGIVHR
jgi:hypothetical protein